MPDTPPVSRVSSLLFGVIGLALGGGATLAWDVPSPAAVSPSKAPASEAAPVIELGEDCPDRRTVLEEQIASRRAELEAITVTDRIREAQRIEREGAPIPWPEDPGDLAPEVLEAALRDAIAEVEGFEFAGMDCEEFPCVVAFAASEDREESGTGLAFFEPVLEGLDARGYGQDRWEGATAGAVKHGETFQHYLIVAFRHERGDANRDTRSMFRIFKFSSEIHGSLEEE